jgi:CRISPR/Cas system-associated protein Csm6
MQTKLTLRLEDALIEKAKAWAKERHISLSQAVAEFFAQLPEKGKKKNLAHLTPWTRRLIGVAAGKGTAPTDEKIRRDYLDYLEAKHR